MGIDLKNFLPSYIEESLEMLQLLEETLIDFEDDDKYLENISTILRTFHSLKSNSAAFSFDLISQLSHTIESFFEPIQNGKQAVNPSIIKELLNAVDCIRHMILCIQNQQPVDEAPARSLITVFTNFINEVEHLEKETPILGKKSRAAPVTQKKGEGSKLEIFPLSELDHSSSSPPSEPIAPFVPEEEPSRLSNSWANSRSNSWKEAALGLGSTSIRISTKKVDNLLNLVGELVITKSILNQVSKEASVIEGSSRLSEGLVLLENNLRELRENVMQIRMLPLSVIFKRCERLVHDLGERTGKKVQLFITGEQTELDKFIIEKITDPLLHLIRNAIDHGIEAPSVRETQGKSPRGTLQINTYQTGEKVYVEVKDDGAGLDAKKIREKALAEGLINENDKLSDQDIYHLIFKAGFSTAKTISDISGRGIGLDVVYNNLRELSGNINIHTTPGQGTTFQLCLPLTLAIFDCQLIKVDNRTYVVPVSNIIKISKYDPACFSVLDANTNLYQIEGHYVPIVELRKIFSYQSNELCLSPKYNLSST